MTLYLWLKPDLLWHWLDSVLATQPGLCLCYSPTSFPLYCQVHVGTRRPDGWWKWAGRQAVCVTFFFSLGGIPSPSLHRAWRRSQLRRRRKFILPPQMENSPIPHPRQGETSNTPRPGGGKDRFGVRHGTEDLYNFQLPQSKRDWMDITTVLFFSDKQKKTRTGRTPSISIMSVMLACIMSCLKQLWRPSVSHTSSLHSTLGLTLITKMAKIAMACISLI